MPTRAPQCCTGCALLFTGGGGPRCPACTPPKTDDRPSSYKRGYGGAGWRQTREKHLASHPQCVQCGSEGEEGLPNNVDHVVPKSMGGLDVGINLQTLCHRCHSRKTAAVDGGFGNKIKI